MSEVNVTPPSVEPPTPEATPTPSLIGEVAPEPKIEGDPAPEPEPFVPLAPTDLVLPEGVTIDEGLMGEFLGVVNDQEMSPKDRAQALVDLQVKAATAASEANSKVWSDMQTEWRNAVKADPEIGGDKLEVTVGRIGRLMAEHGSPELVQVFDMTGAGNNIHMVKFMDKIAGLLTEGKPISGAPVVNESSAAQRMFPSMKG